MKNKPFIPFACCIPVSGYNRSIIYDLNRQSYSYIPNELASILKEQFGKNVLELVESYPRKDREILIEYFEFLEENEYIIYVDDDNKDLFPPLSTEWDYHGSISNAILDIEDENYDIRDILKQLCELGCEYIQLRLKTEAFDYLARILDWIGNGTTIISIELFIPYHQNISSTLNSITANHRVYNVYVYNAPEFQLSTIENRAWGNVIMLNQNLQDKPVQEISYFTVNVKLYTESLHYNNYLNRKLYIDCFGNMKNAPEQLCDFGNVMKDKLEDVVKSEQFQRLWHSKKDDIEICKDCEYRYMCVDSRIPRNLNDIWIHREPCAYNPYIAKWNHKEGFVEAEQCGYFSSKGFIPDAGIIGKILNQG
ncbi:MAG: grasp-with-spasm system SPASM domain peptide maturase [Prevotellaceae bacterium]|jgi:SPASM domain peptide maturase of grasp-with-spasm system|nr:grasp-with-spasm system SPASM domain peptide maturase [Prevotellaceae bacterium]